MRAFEVDERDSSWERYDPHFRIFLFEGAGNAVTTIDLVDVGIGDALKAASDLSQSDRLLWSLASVEQDSSGRRGLVWLSGMDYNCQPGSQAEWRLRREMQHRYLVAKVKRGEAPMLPNGLRLIEMAALWTDGWPLWEQREFRHQLTGDELGLSPELSAALLDWNRVWLEHDELGPVPDGWETRGEELFARLCKELQGVAEVTPPSYYSASDTGPASRLEGWI